MGSRRLSSFEVSESYPPTSRLFLAARSPLSRYSMSEVQLTDDDRIDVALKRFKRLVQRSGLLQELRRRREYVKPSEARQRKAAAAKRRNRKKRRPE